MAYVTMVCDAIFPYALRKIHTIVSDNVFRIMSDFNC